MSKLDEITTLIISALKKGVYYKINGEIGHCEGKDIKQFCYDAIKHSLNIAFVAHPFYITFVGDGCSDIGVAEITYCLTQDAYGKTWAFTKEELE